jgi:hypothetical protein
MSGKTGYGAGGKRGYYPVLPNSRCDDYRFAGGNFHFV